MSILKGFRSFLLGRVAALVAKAAPGGKSAQGNRAHGPLAGDAVAAFGRQVAQRSEGLFLFVPGGFLVLAGVLALIAPRLILALVAGFFLVIGAFFCVLAYKFIQFKRRFEKVARDFEGRLVVQGMSFRQTPETVIQVDQKKIIVH